MTSLGLTSALLVDFSNEFESHFGASLPLPSLFSCSTFRDVVALCQEVTTQGASATPSGVSAGTASSSSHSSELASADVAVVGIGLKLPGGIVGLPEFWETLRTVKSTITKTPTSQKRFQGQSVPAYSSTFDEEDLVLTEAEKAAYTRLLPVNDLGLYEILGLRAVSEALADAGLLVEGSLTTIKPEAGVVGIIYCQGQAETRQNDSLVLSSLEFAFKLRGPCYALSSGCSASALALEHSLDILRHNKASTMLVLSANLLYSGIRGVDQMYSPSDRTKPFDAAADGWLPGEAAICCVLQAVTQHPDPHGYICAAASASGDRFSASGISMSAITTAASRCLAAGDVPTDDICLLELCGTASPLADALEVSALQKLFQQPDSLHESLVLSTAKANFGHVGPASPLLQLCKTIVQLRSCAVPANPSTRTLTSEIDWHSFTRAVFPLEQVVIELPQAPTLFGFVSCLSATGINAAILVSVRLNPEE